MSAPSDKLSGRIRALRDAAVEDGITFNEPSLANFLMFMRLTGLVEHQYLFLNDSGNLGAIWRTGQEQVGLEFRADGKILGTVLTLPPMSKE